MKLIVELQLDNSAFEDNAPQEAQRILTKMMNEWTLVPTDAGKLFDVNGNGVGSWRVEE